MTVYMSETNREYGIRVQVSDDLGSKGPFRAQVDCVVTGAYLAGVERCASVEIASEKGRALARRFYT